MRKILTGLVAAATLAAAATVAPTTADARWGWGTGAFFGGLAAGAIIGGAIAARPYYAYPGYYAYPAPAYAPRCAWHNVWTAYGWRRVCT